MQALQNPNLNPGTATAAALGYERPAGWSAANPYGAKTFGSRLKNTVGLAQGGFSAPFDGNAVGPDPTRFTPDPSQGSALPSMAASGYGMQLSPAQAARAISARPTQMEFANALTVKPGLSLSPQGMTAMLNLREQDLKDQIALAKLASVKANRDNWPDVLTNYYDTHPVMSPFDPSRPLGAEDVQAINGSAQAGSGQSQSISAQDASALPVISSPAAAARLKPGTKSKTPDGRIMQR